MLPSADWTPERLTEVAEGMACRLGHRGPDDAGTWTDSAAGVALGHRRLAIVDLSPAGHQPMESASGRWVIVYNGELYNTKELRRLIDFAGVGFRGHSDSEVLLAAIELWGVEPALEKANGMFAFAAWDRRERLLWLARDRLGEKPLYYGWAGRTFVFASELKALRSHPHFDPRVDRAALARYMSFSNVPSPQSIYEGIYKLSPGCALALPSAAGRKARPRPYWSAGEVATSGSSSLHDLSTGDLASLLLDAVQRRMVADVPLGALLSGGVDSSAIVALMQAASSRRVRTFTIGFTETGFDEAPYARAVAAHLGTEHTELYVTPADAQAVIPRLPIIYDEPFADSSQIPTYLVCELARRSVTVALSGDGGDEIFGGYARHHWAERAWRRSRVVPAAARRGVARAVGRLHFNHWERAAMAIGRARPGSRLADPRLLERARKASSMAAAETPASAYERLVSHWDPARSPVLGSVGPETWTDSAGVPLPTFTEEIMYRDLVGYLPNDILVKVDRASMAVSLEVRAPFLDHRVVEAAWRLPLARKVAGGRGKLALREVLNRYVPPKLIERPKAGFALPLGSWLRGPLRDWAEGLLAEHRLRDEGYLDSVRVRAAWRAHLAGGGDWEGRVWAVLMFQAWLEKERGAPAAD